MTNEGGFRVKKLQQYDVHIERLKRGINQGKFAELCGLSQSYLSQIEGEKVAMPDHIRDRIEIEFHKYDRRRIAELPFGTSENMTIKAEEPIKSEQVEMTTQEQKDTLFHEVANEIAETLAKKNHDYGDSFHKVYEVFGDMSTFIRLTDKMGRMETLVSGKEPKVDNEPLDDVYRDIAGYCILTLVSKKRLQQEG